eukprot:348098_1
MSIKSQRQQRITTNKQQQQFEEDKKDTHTIFDALKIIRDRGITNTKELTWEIMYSEHQNENDKKYNNYDEKQDEKQNETKQINKNERISQLVNTKYNEMCKYGHGQYWDNDKKRIGDNKCIMCDSIEERKCCVDCFYYDRDRTGNDRKDLIPLHTYCKECRIANSKNIKNRIKMGRFKAKIIRNELLKNASLEMDLL